VLEFWAKNLRGGASGAPMASAPARVNGYVDVGIRSVRQPFRRRADHPSATAPITEVVAMTRLGSGPADKGTSTAIRQRRNVQSEAKKPA
jgi:hypothetical protein